MTVIGRRSADALEGPWMEADFAGKQNDTPPPPAIAAIASSSRLSIANNRNANVLEVVNRQPRQHVRVDLVVPELLLVLAEPKTAKPPADIHRRASLAWKDDRAGGVACPVAPSLLIGA